MTINDGLKTRLTELGLNDEQVGKLALAGAATESDIALLSADDLVKETSCGIVTAKKIAAAFAPAPAANPATAAMSSVATFDILPSVPDDRSWLEALKTGGVLKFNRDTVVGTVSAAFAHKVGLFTLPKRIVDAMEKFAESLEEPVGPEFYSMQRALTERSYSEIFAALPGATGRYASEGRKKDLLVKMDERLWPALSAFNGQVNGWMQTWQSTMANPGMMMGAIAAMAGGGGLPAGMMQPPPTDSLRDSAEAVITQINSIFAGTGIPVAMALAYDAQQIRTALENPDLPRQVGASNREQMLKLLGVAVTSDFPRMEQNVKRYTLGVIELPNVTAGQSELAYVQALFMLGSQIPWDRLESGSVVEMSPRRAGIGGGKL